MTDGPVYSDPFNPPATSNPLAVDDAQKQNIKDILDVACSDSRFAQKAYLAIVKTLAGDEASTPLLTSITPSSGASGSVSNPVVLAGANFDPAAEVLQAGVPIGTTFVNDTELNADLNLSGAAPGVLAIGVRNSSGLTSNVVNFTVASAAGQALREKIGQIMGDSEDELKSLTVTKSIEIQK